MGRKNETECLHVTAEKFDCDNTEKGRENKRQHADAKVPLDLLALDFLYAYLPDMTMLAAALVRTALPTQILLIISIHKQ